MIFINIICIAYSQNWAKYVSILVYSIRQNLKCDYKIYLMSDGVDATLFQKYDNVHFIDASGAYEKYITSDINVHPRFSKYSLYRLLIPYLIEEDSVLYFDADTLCFSDFGEVFNMDFGDNYLMMVEDIMADYFKPEIRFTVDDKYFNAGFIFMNLKKLREDKIHEKIINMVNNEFYMWSDQTILNICCKDKIKSLDNIYNSSVSCGYAAMPSIIHFTGNKPWSDQTVHYYNLYKETQDKWDVFLK